MKKSGRGRCSYCGGKKSIRFAGWGRRIETNNTRILLVDENQNTLEVVRVDYVSERGALVIEVSNE